MLSEWELVEAIQGREPELVAAIGDREYEGRKLSLQYVQEVGPGQFSYVGFAEWLCNNFPGWVDDWLHEQAALDASPPRGVD